MVPSAAPTPPEGRGPKWYLTVLAREFPGWVGLNLLFCLTCLPVVTLGPALSALGHVLGRMAADVPTDPVRDYLSAFRAHFLAKLGWGLAFLGSSAGLGFGVWYYAAARLLPLAGLTLAGLLCLFGVALHLFPALSNPKPPARPLRAAALAFLSTFGRSLVALGIALALLLPQLLFFPALVPLTLAGGFVLPGLTLVFPLPER